MEDENIKKSSSRRTFRPRLQHIRDNDVRDPHPFSEGKNNAIKAGRVLSSS